MTDEVDPFNVNGIDGILRPLDEHYDNRNDVRQDPYGAWLAIQNQAARIAELEAALTPFVGAATARAADAPEWKDQDAVSIIVLIRDLRTALAALGEKKDD